MSLAMPTPNDPIQQFLRPPAERTLWPGGLSGRKVKVDGSLLEAGSTVGHHQAPLSDFQGRSVTTPVLQSHLVPFATSLLALLNPLADFAIFLTLTSGRNRREQQGIAVQAAVAIAAIMVSTLWIGNPLLTSFGISIGAFSVAGGIILFGIGLTMLHSKSGESSKQQTHQKDIELALQKESPAIVPLGIPISAGPGVITALLVGSHANPYGVPGLLAYSVICLALAALMGLVFLAGRG
ncbi:MAG: MarC family protein [Vulcanococcus sp.]